MVGQAKTCVIEHHPSFHVGKIWKLTVRTVKYKAGLYIGVLSGFIFCHRGKQWGEYAYGTVIAAFFIHMQTLQSYENVGQSGIKLNHYE